MGSRFIHCNSQVFLFLNLECTRYFHKLKPSKLTWTSMTELCRFSQAKIYAGRGIRFILTNPQVFPFLNSKDKRYLHNKPKPSKLTRADMYRKQHKKIGDPSVEISEENRDVSQESKGLEMEAILEGKLEEAIEYLKKAILLNPSSTTINATRAIVYIRLKNPNAAIRDATAALKIHPDSGYKSPGLAGVMLGQWVESAKDLSLASKLNYDEEIGSVPTKADLT